MIMFCLFVCVQVIRPSQQFFSNFGTEPLFSGYYQYFSGSKVHNTAEVGFEPPASRSGVRRCITEPPRSPKMFYFVREWYIMISTSGYTAVCLLDDPDLSDTVPY